jgi:hypothetical protein
MLASQCDCVFGDHGFAGGGMGGHEYRVTHLQVVNCLLLEGIQLERVLLRTTLSGTQLQERCMKHLVSHVRHELMKVLHRLIYVHHSSPFTFLNVRASCGAVSRAEGCKLGTLGGRFVIPTLAQALSTHRCRQ